MAKKRDRIIGELYREYCAGLQITITKIPELYRVAGKLLDAGAAREAVGSAMREFCQKENQS